MKKILLIAFIALPAYLAGQQKLSYAYDAAGNRTSRTLVVGARSAETATPAASPFFEETLAGKQIKIYPNPVESELTIAIPDYDPSLPQGEFALFSTGGGMLCKGRIGGETTRVDMSSYQPGVYLLHLYLKGEKSVWKVIKE